MSAALEEYTFSELIEPHAEEIRDIGQRAMRAAQPILAAGYRDDSESSSDFMTMFVGRQHSKADANTAVISSVPLLAKLESMEPFVRMISVGLEADVYMADTAHFYLRGKQESHVTEKYSKRTDRELEAHLGSLTIGGELLKRVDWVARREGKPLRDYERIVFIGHSAAAFVVSNAIEVINVPDVDENFSYLYDEYEEFFGDEYASIITDGIFGEIPAVRDSNTPNGVARYVGESVSPRPNTDAVSVSEKALGVEAWFKNSSQPIRKRVSDFISLWPFIKGFRMNTSRPQLVKAGANLPNIHIVSFGGEKSLIHPSQEAESLRSGKNLNRRPFMIGGKRAPYILPSDFENFRSRFRSYEINGMGHNATNSQAFFALLAISVEKGWLPDVDARLR